MKFCSILPMKNYKMMFDQDMVMLLAHLSAKYPKYVKHAVNYKGYKIMDNSIIELGSAFSMDQLITEAIKCDVDEIILPDVFNNGPETVKKVKESIKWLKDRNCIGKFKLMAVCHGRNTKELLDTFNSLKNIPEIDVIGLPKVLYTWMGSRINKAISFTVQTDKQIHLLGCWETLAEYRYLYLGKIRSTDTCMPALLSKYKLSTWTRRKGRKFDLEKDKINKRRYKKIMKDLYENCYF